MARKKRMTSIYMIVRREDEDLEFQLETDSPAEMANFIFDTLAWVEDAAGLQDISWKIKP